MPSVTGGGLETFAVVLTQRQVERIKAIAAARRSEHNRVSVSAVAREVVEAGLNEISRARHTDFTGTDSPVGDAENAA